MLRSNEVEGEVPEPSRHDHQVAVPARLCFIGELDRSRDQVVRLKDPTVEPQRHQAHRCEACRLGVLTPHSELPGSPQVRPDQTELSHPPLVVR